MESPVTVRRATLDDLEMLRGLWRECRQPDYELDKRLTEFQLAFDAQGWLLGALGLRFVGPHAEIHHLALRRPDLETQVREALYERILALAHQQSAHRLWTRDPGAFWADKGFTVPGAPEIRELPPRFGHPSEPWRTLKLREDPLRLVAAEEQLEAYLELERLKVERLVRRGRVLRLLATAIAVGILGLALGALVLVLRQRRRNAPLR